MNILEGQKVSTSETQNFQQEVFQILAFPTASSSWVFARRLAVILMQAFEGSYLTPEIEHLSSSCSILCFTKTNPGPISRSHQDPDFNQ